MGCDRSKYWYSQALFLFSLDSIHLVNHTDLS